MNDDTRTTAEALEDAAMRPEARIARARAMQGETAEEQPLPKGVARKPADQKSAAEWAYERLILYVENFEKQLDADHEVAMGFAGGDVGTLHIHGMGYFAPDLITFYGADEAGVKTQLVQHVSQLNVMFKAAPKLTREPTRIGFALREQLEKDD